MRRRPLASHLQTETQKFSASFLAHSPSILSGLKDVTYCRKGIGFTCDKRNIQNSPGGGKVVTRSSPLKTSKSVVYKNSGIFK